jgi:type VI secretion system protein ImpA
MPSPGTVDFEALLAPIAGENPAGQSVRYTGVYDTIQEARRADDDLAQGDWKKDIKKADWHAVIELATETLRTKCKDLQIAAWLTEALVKQNGFAGLRDGVRLLRELQTRFWASLYPEIEEGDLEFRAAPLAWLNEKLPLSIRNVSVTQSRDGDNYSWFHWQESRTVDNLARQSQEALSTALADGKITSEQFDGAVAATSRAHYEGLFDDLTQCVGECEQLDRVLDEEFGRDAPSLLNVKKAVDDCLALITAIVRKKRELEPDAAPQGVAEGGEGSAQPYAGTTTSAASAGGAVPLEPRDRPDALRRLAAVAAFFRRTEPHSPISYLVQRAVKWGEMPLEHWLKEVIRDDNVLANVRETLGLKDSAGGKTE